MYKCYGIISEKWVKMWWSFALVFTGEIKLAPFMNTIIGLVNLYTSATLRKRIKVYEQKENCKQNNSKFGEKKEIFFLLICK